MDEKNPWMKYDYWDDEIEIIKSILNKTELIETTKWGGIVYTINNKNVIGVGAFKNYFALWFYNGVFLKDELNVLITTSIFSLPSILA